MKASGGFGSRWMTDLINNIVKEGCIPDWRKSILVPAVGRELEPQKPRVPVTYMEKSTKTDGVKYNA